MSVSIAGCIELREYTKRAPGGATEFRARCGMGNFKYWIMVFMIACGFLIGFVVMVRLMNLAFTYPVYQSMRNLFQQKIDEPGQSAHNKRVIEKTINTMGQDMLDMTFGITPESERIPENTTETGPVEPEVVWQTLGKELVIKRAGKVMNSPFATATEIATVSRGTKATILEKRYTQLKIRLEQGTEGWVNEDLFSPASPGTPRP
ncbi:hypothetical protein ACFL27_07645 [candidate division CSSED10-310 bacterium]|uniref:SH3b domain-containing protein n=1 Tax=candidate division CSSED10-310 bacterium TaxID=2855610 RepID=A0ABV6YVE9_UNCC1